MNKREQKRERDRGRYIQRKRRRESESETEVHRETGIEKAFTRSLRNIPNENMRCIGTHSGSGTRRKTRPRRRCERPARGDRDAKNEEIPFAVGRGSVQGRRGGRRGARNETPILGCTRRIGNGSRGYRIFSEANFTRVHYHPRSSSGVGNRCEGVRGG